LRRRSPAQLRVLRRRRGRRAILDGGAPRCRQQHGHDHGGRPRLAAAAAAAGAGARLRARERAVPPLPARAGRRRAAGRPGRRRKGSGAVTDFFRIDDLLTPEERAVRDMTRAFVEEHVLPVVGQLWEEGRFPEEWPRLFGEQGLLGANLPEEYGGAGVGSVAYGLMMQELEAADSGVRSFASVQGALVMYPIFQFGSEDQRRHWLPRLAKGEVVGCFGLTETSAGSDPARMQTRARRQNGRWVLSGTKMWTTNGNLADVAVIWARDEDGEYRGFLVETDLPGFSAVEIKHKLSMRLSNTAQLFLDNVVVSDDARLPGAVGLRAPLMCLTQARYGIAWGAMGAARAAYEEALEYAKQRESFGSPIAAR